MTACRSAMSSSQRCRTFPVDTSSWSGTPLNPASPTASGSSRGSPGSPGASTSVLRQVPAGRPIRVQVSVDLYGDSLAEAEFQAPACPLPATAPTMTIEVTVLRRERRSDRGHGHEPARRLRVSLRGGGLRGRRVPPEGDASFWSYSSQVSPADGEHAAVVVDELTFRSPTDEAGRVQPLAAGDYLVQLSWAVPDYGGSLSTNALITVPASAPSAPATTEVRVASFNPSLTRAVEGELATDLSTPDDPQAAAVAEIIQRTPARRVAAQRVRFRRHRRGGRSVPHQLPRGRPQRCRGRSSSRTCSRRR